ncbi:hypothetical protein AX15_000062 [Amanita polypyramis BW_CC]|nr:hypothetical protein AX15_000062 [Amanita polypyramis BW_CC]
MHHNNHPLPPPQAASMTPPGLLLPTPSIQNQIHELAKTLPPPRKQNTACDACRTRKVKCNRLPGQDKCQHCLTKNYPCTHYVQQATSERKRNSSMGRRPRNANQGSHSIIPSNFRFAFPPQDQILGAAAFVNNSIPLMVKFGFHPSITVTTPSRDVLSFVFAPPDNGSDLSMFHPGRAKSSYDAWGEEAHRLEDGKFKAEFAQDLVEVFFQIVHTRIPLLNPAQFRSRLQLNSSTGEKTLHPALVATVLAWGSKFSEHPLLVADRKRPGGQSLLARALVDRARDLAEALKVHRIPSSDHVVICLLIEPLQSQNPDDPNGFHGFWLSSATRHLLDLGINHKSVMTNISDPESRGTMIFAWWMTCICDAYSSVYYRRKPILDDDDYDIDFYTVEPINPEATEQHNGMPSPRLQLEFLGYYRAAHSLARTARKMSRHLWKPGTESDGVPYDVLSSFSHDLVHWKEQYLHLVGVPNGISAEWDFVSVSKTFAHVRTSNTKNWFKAVSCCASDATYHVMWIILFNALDEFGVKELNTNDANVDHTQIDSAKRKVAEEALYGALRIAGLANVLTSNGYLKLDPAVMHYSCNQSGTFLARLGRPEVSHCVAGLEQYSVAYEEAGEQAAEMRRMYHQARSGELELNHMTSVTPRIIDQHVASKNGSSKVTF